MFRRKRSRILQANRLVPSWATPRSDDWKFAGWIDINADRFDELVEHSKQSDHGEEREVDIYEQGAVCWCRER